MEVTGLSLKGMCLPVRANEGSAQGSQGVGLVVLTPGRASESPGGFVKTDSWAHARSIPETGVGSENLLF